MATSPATFLPSFCDYLRAKLRLSRERVQVDTSGPVEVKAADGKVLTIVLAPPKPYGSPDQGAGRTTYQVTRSLSVILTTANTGDHGSNRERLLTAHWNFEDAVLDAIQQCNYRVLNWNRPPALQTGSEEYKHTKDLVGGVQSALVFEITYTANVAADQPGPPV
jgi:hypothetical protein